MIRIIGIPSSAPDTPKNLSSTSSNSIAKKTPKKQIIVLLRFFNHFLVVVFVINLIKMNCSRIMLVGYMVKGYEKTRFMQNNSLVIIII